MAAPKKRNAAEVNGTSPKAKRVKAFADSAPPSKTAATKKRAAPAVNGTTLPKRVKPSAPSKTTGENEEPNGVTPKVNGVAKSKTKPAAEAPTKTAAPKASKALKIINTTPTIQLNILACGEGGNGELGLGPKATDVKRPRLNQLLDSVGVVQLDAGGMHCVALAHDNKILTWGVSDEGALGRDATETSNGKMRDIDDESDSDDEITLNPKESTPTAISDDTFPTGTKFVQVAAGDSASFALTDTGLVYGWGTFRVSPFICI
jgi:regulator of chromosome condensation